MNIADKINVLKNKLDITTQELSEKSGVPVGTINKILNGETKNPTMNTLAKIASALGVTTEYFFDIPAPESKDEPTVDELVTELHAWLVSIGYIKEGEDITQQQLEVLSGIIKILDASFGSAS